VTATKPPMTPLAQKLAARIAAEGPVTQHDYMEACLYDPGHGYYKKREALGRGGDFITAPEISQVFGELTGLWAGETWRLMGQPSEVRLIELGPGRGTLMADALRALRVLPVFLQCATVHLVETSGPMRAAQEAALAAAPCPVFWHERIEDVPEGAAIVIANEFFDCLPVRQHVFDEPAQLWRERLVAFKDGAFEFALSKQAAGSVVLGQGLPDIEDGAIAETRPGTTGVLRSLAARAANAPLAALIIDYGYSHPALGDTVQAVRQHRFTGLFDAPGEADLTAHVDFSALAQGAKELGLASSGPMPMGEWLLRLGLETRVNQLMRRASSEEAAEIRSRVSRLVDPAQMGALFKVLVLTGGVQETLPPFYTESG
jgi:NADH dehydrogenase [ubiquinone] 1 alpha subcomplex assembly factor 7